MNQSIYIISQFVRHVVDGTLKALKYHGQGRKSDPQQLLDFDIILTTYATVSSEHSKDLSPLQNIDWFRIVLDEGLIWAYTLIEYKRTNKK